MKIAKRIATAWNALTGRYSETTGQWVSSWPGPSASGVQIDEYSALTVSDYYKCVNLGSRTLASLPWKVFEPVEFGKNPLPDHYLYSVLHRTPNDVMTSFIYRIVMMRHVLCWGNHWSIIERQGYSGRTVALWPLLPQSYKRYEQDKNGEMWWVFWSQKTGKEARFRFSDILHIPWLPYDGILGCTPIRLLMDAAGAAKATELYGARFFGNNARPDGVLSSPNALSREARERIKESWNEAHQGENAHRIAVLEEGLNFQAMTMNSEHAQFIETRKFHATDICGWFPMPPHLIGNLDRATNNNIEQQTLDYSIQFVMPWAECIEQECNRKLFMPRETGTLYTKLMLKGLLRGDLAARTAHYQAMWNIGAYTDNDILEMEDMNGWPGGTEHFVQLNMTTIDNAKNLAAMPKATPATPSANVAEMQARVQRAYLGVFSDLIGRILQRKPNARPGFAASAGIFAIQSLSQLILSTIPADFESFSRDYAENLGRRSALWEADNQQIHAIEELDRATQAIMERGSR